MADDEDVLEKENESPKKETEVSENEPSLEEIADSPVREADIFSESSMEVRDMPTPTIPASESIASPFRENLEQSAAESIGETVKQTPASQPSQRVKEQEEYVNVYNAPDYTSREEVVAFKQMRERGMAANNLEELRQTQRIVPFETPSQLRQTENLSDERDYAVMEVGKREDEHRSPLERKKDYRPLKR